MQAGAQSLDAFERIDRASSDFDADFLEGETMSCEVNQLLTAIWSPIASVEQDDRPMPGDRSDHVTRVAFVIDALNCWKFRSVLKDEHGGNVSHAASSIGIYARVVFAPLRSVSDRATH